MAYVFSTNNIDESNHENLNSNGEKDVPLFGQFPSPFFDDMPHNQQEHTTSIAANEAPSSPSKGKRVRKKRSAGKKDRHSKIHTAQGLRDRRMRLSLHIARKFFGLQDMLGFDKASKTIEWLFCHSKEAIDVVTESVRTQNTTQLSASRENIESCESPFSDGEADSAIEFDATSNKGKQLRDMARARARERTREKKMIENLDKSKQTFIPNPNQDFDQLQLGFSSNPNLEDSSTSPLDYSGTHHFFDHSNLIHNIPYRPIDHSTVASSSLCLSGYGYNKDYANQPAGWLNSSNTFLGFVEGWDSENYTENYGFPPHLAPSTSDTYIPSSNLVHYQTQNQRD